MTKKLNVHTEDGVCNYHNPKLNFLSNSLEKKLMICVKIIPFFALQKIVSKLNAHEHCKNHATCYIIFCL